MPSNIVVAVVAVAAAALLGSSKGPGMVERVEKYAVGVNLAVIAAVIGGLLWVRVPSRG